MEKNIKLYQSNVLTQARYELSVMEKRAVYLIIKEVRRKFVLTDEGQRDLFDDLIIYLNRNELDESSNKNGDLMYKSLTQLRKRDITINDNDFFLNVGFINYSEHKKGEGKIQIQVSNKILPYLVELSKEYTEYSLTVAISLKSQWSQRFYEYCSQFKNTGGFKVSINDLREKLKIENKYEKYASLKKRVIETAQKELKDLYEKGQCDLYFNYSETKMGRSVTDLTFKIISRTPGEEILSDEDIDYIVRWPQAKNGTKLPVMSIL